MIQKIDPQNPEKLSNVLRLEDGQVDDFLNLLQAMKVWNPADATLPSRIDSTLFQRMLEDRGAALGQVYSQQPNKVRELIEKDPSSKDVAAIASRKKAVADFEE